MKYANRHPHTFASYPVYVVTNEAGQVVWSGPAVTPEAALNQAMSALDLTRCPSGWKANPAPLDS